MCERGISCYQCRKKDCVSYNAWKAKGHSSSTYKDNYDKVYEMTPKSFPMFTPVYK